MDSNYFNDYFLSVSFKFTFTTFQRFQGPIGLMALSRILCLSVTIELSEFSPEIELLQEVQQHSLPHG